MPTQRLFLPRGLPPPPSPLPPPPSTTMQVEYESEGFLEKNKDALPDAVVEALRFSSLRLLRTLFTRDPCSYTGSQLKKSVLRKRYTMAGWLRCLAPGLS